MTNETFQMREIRVKLFIYLHRSSSPTKKIFSYELKLGREGERVKWLADVNVEVF